LQVAQCSITTIIERHRHARFMSTRQAKPSTGSRPGNKTLTHRLSFKHNLGNADEREKPADGVCNKHGQTSIVAPNLLHLGRQSFTTGEAEKSHAARLMSLAIGNRNTARDQMKRRALAFF